MKTVNMSKKTAAVLMPGAQVILACSCHTINQNVWKQTETTVIKENNTLILNLCENKSHHITSVISFYYFQR